jgi:secreted Zn-dependent insulinase-like peptidase
MDTFLEKMREKVKTMTDEEFDKSRNSVLTNLEEKDKNQREEFARLNNGEISQHRLVFDRQ